MQAYPIASVRVKTQEAATRDLRSFLNQVTLEHWLVFPYDLRDLDRFPFESLQHIRDVSETLSDRIRVDLPLLPHSVKEVAQLASVAAYRSWVDALALAPLVSLKLLSLDSTDPAWRDGLLRGDSAVAAAEALDRLKIRLDQYFESRSLG